ncbi:hypothetical protein F5X97DRAFT_304860 [Nemania serpens]|nr:hypothetical protein F5X97DRAFT_304860 [Nemania serpens]
MGPNRITPTGLWYQSTRLTILAQYLLIGTALGQKRAGSSFMETRLLGPCHSATNALPLARWRGLAVQLSEEDLDPKAKTVIEK